MTIKRAKPSGTSPVEIRRAVAVLDKNFQEVRASDIMYDDDNTIAEMIADIIARLEVLEP